MPHRPPNSLWGKGLPAQPQPARVCEFEMYTQHLGLSEYEYTASLELREWCEKHKNRCYIPEWLLKRWRMDVDNELPGLMPSCSMRRNPLS